MRVEQFMTPKDSMVWAYEDQTILDVATKMVEKKVSCCVVVKTRNDDEKHLYPIGLVSKTDLVSTVLAGHSCPVTQSCLVGCQLHCW